MKKFLLPVLIGLALSGCQLIHKNDIVQGNVISQEDVSRLHRGMTEAAVRQIMGTPVFTNIFAVNRIDYVYTFQAGYQSMTEKRLTLIFVGGRLRDIQEVNV